MTPDRDCLIGVGGWVVGGWVVSCGSWIRDPPCKHIMYTYFHAVQMPSRNRGFVRDLFVACTAKEYVNILSVVHILLFISSFSFINREVKLDIYGKRQTAKIKLFSVCLQLFVQ